ncbi:fumarylacetoacetate hydrolase family protein [Corynebacterium caspium]|uniref:fumarylacetoacetate hydrolase family protein n=1 Tax=Corynebacterium caspium TaxID=234828 RepID=UPI00037C12E7|nr:fumarylacetoacetate hydrolase family protein [Corynebacterium caspium]WKD59585.1 Ureidoglycolate lyase [Corynebacterium caspium DSM 44850]
MQLATLNISGTTRAAKITGPNTAILLPYSDVGEFLNQPDWQTQASTAVGTAGIESTEVDFKPADLAPVIPKPSKIICVGLNYAQHIQEMGRVLPKVPTLFIKFPEALIGPYADILVPPWRNNAVDWEGELAVIIGKYARRVAAVNALEHIAGYAIINDCTQRDHQNATLQWHQGKSQENSAGFGPWLTTTDSFQPGPLLETQVNGVLKQQGATDDLVFSPEKLVEFISHIYPLNPGDVIATGTPAGVGVAQNPPQCLRHGDIVKISVAGLGSIENKVIFEQAPTNA